MNYNFFIVGGDKRIFYLAESLADDGNNVKIYGPENLILNSNLNKKNDENEILIKNDHKENKYKEYEKNNFLKLENENEKNKIKNEEKTKIKNEEKVQIADSLNEIEKEDIIISSVPLSIDGENVYAPFSKNKIKLKELEKIVRKNDNIFFAGKIPSFFYAKNSEINISQSNEKINLNEKQNNEKEKSEKQNNEKQNNEKQNNEKEKSEKQNYENEIDNKNKLKKIIENKNEKIFDVLENEEVTIMNTVSTAEGAISKAIEESEIILDGSNILILGFGRVGKSLAHKLKAFNSNVYVEARKEKDLAWIKALGYKPIPLEKLEENLCKMRIIFNTIPHQILNKDRLIYVKNDTLIIDLASKPYGVDFEASKKLKIKSILYSGIPGKVAPESSANIIKLYINKKLQSINKLI